MRIYVLEDNGEAFRATHKWSIVEHALQGRFGVEVSAWEDGDCQAIAHFVGSECYAWRHGGTCIEYDESMWPDDDASPDTVETMRQARDEAWQ